MQTTWICTLSLTATLLLTGCSKKKETEEEPALPVRVTAARIDSVQRVINAEGILRALDQSAVMPKISAPVSKFYVNRGDHVRRGQVLATLENRDLAAGVVDARGSLEQAAASYRNVSSATVPDELVKAQSDADAARKARDAAMIVVQSRTKLLQEGAIAKRLVDEAAVAYVQADSNYQTAQKHLESMQSVGRQEEVKTAAGGMDSARGKFQAAQAQLQYSQIRSPISGVIADRAIFAGEMAAAGSALLTVMDISSVIARLNIPQAQAAFIKRGQSATVAATDSDIQVVGRVTVVSPAVDPQTTTVEVWVQAPNPGERLRPGGTVKVAIQAGVVTNAIVVPAAAILPAQEGGSAVMVVGADSLAHEHKVEIGVRDGDKVQILSGVDAAMRVVTEGGVGLAGGAKVEVGHAEKAGEKGKGEKKKGAKDEDDKAKDGEK
ncbi:MAG TPA: efflux RND transporter periplasmic adaptor subunit [Solibacterales bacterium]|nr:efflux RND transporter periplasmic adaptor subunit [Bryobacterales bacterium]